MKGRNASLRLRPFRRVDLRLSVVSAICLVALSSPFHYQHSAQAQRQQPYSIECEDWVSSTQPSAGNVSRQEMGNFGSGWSRNAQLLWTPPPPVDKPIRNWPHLSHMFAPPAEGNFEIILHYTAAPDFGIFRVFIDSQNKADIDGYAPAVTPRSRSLGQFQLKAGSHQFLITVVGRAASAKNFFVGLDRLELRTESSAIDFGRVMDPIGNRGSDQGRRVDPPQRGGNPQIPAAQLFFATYSSSTQKFTVKAGTERLFNRRDLHQHFIWESPSYANQVNWRWQVSLQPFSAIRAGASTLAEDDVSSSSFTINFGSFPPLNSLQTMRRGVVNFYVRILPMRNGQLAGPSSNTVVARYDPGSVIDPPQVKDGGPPSNQARPYKLEIISFTPAIFPDPNRQGCVKVIKNPYYANIPAASAVMMTKLADYKPGTDKEYCPEHKSMSYQATFWDYPGGWFKVYNIISEFYEDIKNLAASEFAQTFCGVLKNPPKCKENAKKLAGVAINVGLTAAGLPSTLPDLDDIAKGAVVDAAVNYSCMAVESQGGVCTPELRALFAKGYKEGLDQLIKNNERLAKEPFCESFDGALPCFTNPKYKGVEIEAAKGAVFQPPSVSVRVTLINPSHSWSQSEARLKASLWLHNIVPAGTRIENRYAKVPETKLDGELFVPVEAPVPFLGVGQSANVTLVFDRVQQYKFSTTKDDQGKATGYTEHNGWCHLYEGGHGSVIVSFLPNSSGHEAEQPIQLPKAWKCTFSP